MGRASTAPVSSNHPDPICSAGTYEKRSLLSNASFFSALAQLVVPGPGSFVYKYKTEVKLSVANSQFDIKSVINAEAHIKSLNDCNYAVQVREFS